MQTKPKPPTKVQMNDEQTTYRWNQTELIKPVVVDRWFASKQRGKKESQTPVNHHYLR